MSQDALPCFKCGRLLRNVFEDADNQPSDGTEFRTYGHYGSTFWDSFDGEELILNICDPCLRDHKDRLAQQKRFLPIRCEGFVGLGQQWVDRPIVPFTGHRDDTEAHVTVDELGTDIAGVEWVADIEERKADLLGPPEPLADWERELLGIAGPQLSEDNAELQWRFANQDKTNEGSVDELLTDPADRTVFTLDEEQWKQFMEMLDREPRDLAKLSELMKRPSPFEEGEI